MKSHLFPHLSFISWESNILNLLLQVWFQNARAKWRRSVLRQQSVGPHVVQDSLPFTDLSHQHLMSSTEPSRRDQEHRYNMSNNNDSSLSPCFTSNMSPIPVSIWSTDRLHCSEEPPSERVLHEDDFMSGHQRHRHDWCLVYSCLSRSTRCPSWWIKELFFPCL